MTAPEPTRTVGDWLEQTASESLRAAAALSLLPLVRRAVRAAASRAGCRVNDVDEIANPVLADLAGAGRQGLADLDPAKSMSASITVRVRSRIADAMRKDARRREVPECGDAEPAVRETPPRRYVWPDLSRLPPRQRELMKRLKRGDSIKAAAAAMGVSLGAAYELRRRALARLAPRRRPVQEPIREEVRNLMFSLARKLTRAKKVIRPATAAAIAGFARLTTSQAEFATLATRWTIHGIEAKTGWSRASIKDVLRRAAVSLREANGPDRSAPKTREPATKRCAPTISH